MKINYIFLALIAASLFSFSKGDDRPIDLVVNFHNKEDNPDTDIPYMILTFRDCQNVNTKNLLDDMVEINSQITEQGGVYVDKDYQKAVDVFKTRLDKIIRYGIYNVRIEFPKTGVAFELFMKDLGHKRA